MRRRAAQAREGWSMQTELTRRGFIGGVASIGTAAAWGQPGRHVTIVVGLAAGGGTDVIARVLQPKLQDGLAQNVVVENRTGASGMIAAEYLTRAQPDGQTLMLAPSGVIVANAVIRRKMPYSVQDLAPVCLVCTFPMLLLADARAPVKTLPELVAWVKANPARANSSGSGAAFELQTALLSQKTGAPIQFVQYRGTNESVAAVVAGDVLLTFADVGPAIAAIRGGRVRPLAATSSRRSRDFPEVPTMRELGFPELEAEYWMGLFAPARTPPATLMRVEGEMKKVLAQPEVQAGLASRFVEPRWAASAEFGERIQADLARWTQVRAAAGIPQVD
jgi:tripartite-type tricarboxylate transporter receptor subunit TctC